ncbi:MAG: cytochrome c biosis factor [Acidimicrobiaceae bacterium]|nr:cytochrome c biosis factor [Acidimicrobiaceae bacterium]
MSGPVSPGRSLADLAEERDFLLRSIEDLEREHAAGDVDDADYAALRAGYVGRAAATLREISAAATPPGTASQSEDEQSATPPFGHREQKPASTEALTRGRRARRFLGRRGTRRVLVPLGLVCALGLVSVVAARAAGVRLPGATATGSVTLSSAAQVRQELDQASVLASEGQLSNAISVYDTVLRQTPHQPEALAYKGWFIRLAGLAAHSPVAVADGDATLGSAVRYAPGYAEARAFYGIALLDDEGDGPGALVQFRAFLSDRPSSTLLGSVGAQMAKAFVAEHATVPAPLRRFEAKAATAG